MANANQFPQDQFATENDPGGISVVGCIDKRQPGPASRTLARGAFPQILGSRWGAGIITAGAMEAARPGSFTDLRIPAAQFAHSLGSVLEGEGIITIEHGTPCGAITKAAEIHAGVGSGPSGIKYHLAEQFRPGLTTDRYQRVVEGHQRISAAGLASGSEEIRHAFRNDFEPRSLVFGAVGRIEPAPYAELVPNEAPNVHNVIDYRPDVLFDQEAAERAGYAAYYSTARTLDDILVASPDAISDIVSREIAYDAMAVLLGEIAAAHITGHGTDGAPEPYPITAIGWELVS